MNIYLSKETKTSGKAASNYARNAVYQGRSWTRKSNGRKNPKTVASHILDLNRSRIIEHCNVMSHKKKDLPVRNEVHSVHSFLPMDYGERVGEVDAMAELSELIEYALSTRKPRFKVKSVVIGGVVTSVTEPLPERKLETLGDFIEAFPSLRAALTRLASKI